MTSRFVEIIPPYHRQGNGIPSAAIRWPDLGDRPWFGRPFGQIFRHSDTPLLSRSLDRAIELAQEAIRLNDVTGYPHLILAQVHLSRREFGEASMEADLAVSARPSCPAAYSLKASVLIYLGRPSEAIEHAQYALRLTPVHPPMHSAILASAFYSSERYEEAVAAAKTAIELDEFRVDPYLILAASSVILDHSEEARWAAQKVLKLKPEFSLAEFAKSQPYKEPRDLDRLINQLRSAGLDKLSARHKDTSPMSGN